MERVKNQRLAQFLRGIERVGGFGGKSDLLASSQVYLGSPDAYKASLKRIESATTEDVRSAGKRWLSDGRPVRRGGRRESAGDSSDHS